jgi:predicted Zn-dependent protease with MMP-like domain
MAGLTREQRERFDRLLEAEINALPPQVLQWLDEVPVIVEDEPDEQLLDEMDVDDDDDLMGVHSGIPLTQRSVEDQPDVPDHIMIFRRPIYETAGWPGEIDRRALRREIHVTLLHEIGHHFGLDEDDLARLGYE